MLRARGVLRASGRLHSGRLLRDHVLLCGDVLLRRAANEVLLGLCHVD